MQVQRILQLAISVGRADHLGVLLRPPHPVAQPAATRPRDEPPPARLRLRPRRRRRPLARRLRRLLPPQRGHRQPLLGRRRQGADHQVRRKYKSDRM